jgi:hypothetical protein
LFLWFALEFLENGKSQSLTALILLLSLPCSAKRTGTKAPMLSQSTMYKMQGTPFDRAFPNSPVLDHAMHRSLKSAIQTMSVMPFSFLVIRQYV